MDGWTLLAYEVSNRTGRIGWVEETLSDNALTFASVPLIAAADTFLTDDPFVSQYAQCRIPAGTARSGLARCGGYYAYVDMTQGDKRISGFVPLKDLHPAQDRALTTGEDARWADTRRDVVDALNGKWRLVSGEEGAVELYTLFFDGGWRTFRHGDFPDDITEGSFRIYGGDDALTLLLSTEDNTETRFGLTLNEDGSISLLTENGESIYWRNEYSTCGNG